MKGIGKTEKGKLYHIVNNMTGGGHFGLCGCYMPDDKRLEDANAFELEKENKMCERCMYIRFYKQDRD